MDASKCPRCGSDQVLSDQCLKCGVVISKYRPPTAESSTPVSFVATPSRPETAGGYSIPSEVLQAEARRRKSRFQTNILTAVVFVVVVLCGYAGVRFFIRKAAHFSGEYRNVSMMFVLYFPQQNSQWFHYRKDEWDSPLLQEAGDAFYRGDDPGEPELLVGAWHTGIRALPERFDAATAESLRTQEEDALLETLSKRGIEATLTKSELTVLGGNHGFHMEADLKVDGAPVKLIALRGYNLNHSYWFFIAGAEGMMNRYSDEVKTLESSLGFKVSPV